MMQLDLFPTDVDLRCIDPDSDRRHFYALSIQRTLFDEWALVREWGRIGGCGRLRRDLYPSAGMAIDALYALAQKKKRQGYAPIGA